MVEQQDKRHILGVATTLCIILMLIFAGPSSAVMVQLSIDGLDNKQVGQSGFFYFNVTIGGNERVPITNFTITGLPAINGSPGGILLFNLSDTGTTAGGNATKGNYEIELVAIHGWTGGTDNITGNASNYGYGYSSPYLGYGYGYTFSGASYGYGYGYGYGLPNPSSEYTKLSYKITVDTTGATAGTYNMVGKVNTGDSTKPYFATASATSFTLAPAAQNNNTVSIADVTLPWGSTQTVPIRLLNSTGVCGVNVTLTFNRSIVNTTTAVAGDFDSTFNPDYSNVSDGVLRISCIKSGQNLTGDLTIATVTLHAVAASGTCGLNLSAELVNRTGVDVSSNVENGTFTINETAATTPPAPENLQYTVNGDWVNYTWQAGSIGHGTDSYNVSLGGLWDGYNGTATFLNTSVGAGNWSNITVWAYNATGSGNMSLNNVSDEVQAPSGVCGDVSGDDAVTIYDKTVLGLYVGEVPGWTIASNWAGDVSGDGEVTIYDKTVLGLYVGEVPGWELNCTCSG